MFELGPALRNGDGTLWSRAISLAYPVSDVAVITIVIVVFIGAEASGRAASHAGRHPPDQAVDDPLEPRSRVFVLLA